MIMLMNWFHRQSYVWFMLMKYFHAEFSNTLRRFCWNLKHRGAIESSSKSETIQCERRNDVRAECV
ncbi:hypothetical protein GBF38_000131 [Nibea albiflora]|nr:hypothetical protein GBF38_000131 [Nibea albiflora]